MNRTELLLECLTEECAEVIQRVCKANRFGLEETQPGQSMTNADRIRYEVIDVIAIVETLVEQGVFVNPYFRPAIEDKKAKVEKYLEYSEQCGTLTR